MQIIYPSCSPRPLFVCTPPGDCCTVEEGERLPATAQVASQQAAYVTRLLNRGFDLKKGGEAAPEREGGQTADPFQFLSLGLMAYIGA